MTRHIHAELMAQYAQDAMETDKPWKRWECKECEFNSFMWRAVSGNPTWKENYKYRRKHKPYPPTLLDQALELEIEALNMRIEHNKTFPASMRIYTDMRDRLKNLRTPAMIEHLKQEGKL